MDAVSLSIASESGVVLPMDCASRSAGGIKSLIADARRKLMAAETSADILDAKARASIAFDAARRLAALAEKRRHHELVVTAARELQADSLEIEFLADRRLADEVDAARAAGLLLTNGRPSKDHGKNGRVVLSDIGVTRVELMHARQVRDVLAMSPGVLRLALNEVMARGSSITRAFVRKEVLSAAAELRGERRKPSVIDGGPWLFAYSGDVRKRTFSELKNVLADLEFEVNALRQIYGHIANPDPFAKVGDSISDHALSILCLRVQPSNGGAA